MVLELYSFRTLSITEEPVPSWSLYSICKMSITTSKYENSSNKSDSYTITMVITKFPRDKREAIARGPSSKKLVKAAVSGRGFQRSAFRYPPPTARCSNFG